MNNGYKLEDKCLRNELLILINYLMVDEKTLYFFDEKSNVPWSGVYAADPGYLYRYLVGVCHGR